MSNNLNNKKALVTGGARGIGLATVEALARAGADVTFTARNQPSMDQALKDLPVSITARGIICDATDQPAVKALMAEGFDILINNAGIIGPIGRITDVDIGEWAKNIEVNLTSAFYVIQQALPHMIKNGGTIVNLSSGAAHGPMEGWSAYCSGKAGLAMLTRCVDKEYGEQGIRIFGFAPGLVDTGMQGSIRESGINPVSGFAQSDLSPASEPAQGMVWLCTSAADDLAGSELDVRQEDFRRRSGLETST
ncbi:MAG: SDR family NAD(P)-dependent oxidoreductase [Hyphomicrobiales bacterium]